MSRKQHWDKIYTNKTPLEVSWFQEEPVQSLQLIKATTIDQNAAIIDVGGGASHLVDHLLEIGYTNLAVLDISSSAIEHSKTRLGKQADSVEWFVQDVTQFKSPRKYDCWHDRAVFHFLTDENDRERYVECLNHAVIVGGQVIIATFAIGGPEKCSGLDIVQYDENKIKQVLGDNYQLVELKHELHVTPNKKEQNFVYFNFKKIQ